MNIILLYPDSLIYHHELKSTNLYGLLPQCLLGYKVQG